MDSLRFVVIRSHCCELFKGLVKRVGNTGTIEHNWDYFLIKRNRRRFGVLGLGGLTVEKDISIILLEIF